MNRLHLNTVNTLPVTVNGQPHTVSSNTTLAQLLCSLHPGIDPDASPMASAVNGRHVARKDRSTCVLCAHDAITTFEPISGG
jgi:thiamine biosynthesis protein ThiS